MQQNDCHQNTFAIILDKDHTYAMTLVKEYACRL